MASTEESLDPDDEAVLEVPVAGGVTAASPVAPITTSSVTCTTKPMKESMTPIDMAGAACSPNRW